MIEPGQILQKGIVSISLTCDIAKVARESKASDGNYGNIRVDL